MQSDCLDFHIYITNGEASVTFSCSFSYLNSFIQPDSPQVHIMSAASAGFVSSSVTNPIWFVKTRLQLDYNSKVQMTVKECIERVYAQGGISAFYKGITASYFGICETVVHFVIYEFIKSKLVSVREEKNMQCFKLLCSINYWFSFQ